MNNQTNEIKLGCVLDWRSSIVKLSNGTSAINGVLVTSYGRHQCRFMCTAYGELAEKLDLVKTGEELHVFGALYQDTGPGADGRIQYWTKIRINSFEIVNNAPNDAIKSAEV